MFFIAQSDLGFLKRCARRNREACGFLSGTSRTIENVFPVKNISKEKNRFEMSFLSKMMALTKIFLRDWGFIMIYHTHPAGRDLPSKIDRREFSKIRNLFFAIITPEKMSVYLIFKKGSRVIVSKKKLFLLKGV